MTAPVVDVGGGRLIPLLPAGRAASDLANHRALYGEHPASKMLGHDSPAALRRMLDASGLTGRGGAAHPSAEKWALAPSRGTAPLLVVNAMEGEPASAKDHLLLTCAPHLVIEGAEVIAMATRARKVVVCIGSGDKSGTASMLEAIAERRRAGTIAVDMSVETPPSGYVSGEESALVAWLRHGASLPEFRPDKSVPLRLGRQIAIVHNVETVANASLIARYGPDWFRSAGTPQHPGTVLVTVCGAVARPGVIEVGIGTPIISAIEQSGVCCDIRAVLCGGYSGTWIDSAQLKVPYEPQSLSAVGATMGVGVMVVLPQTSCGLAETARIARYMAGESAGQCGPCVFGLPALADDLEKLAFGAGRIGADLYDRLQRRLATVDGRGACRHPDGVVRLIRSALEVFGDDLVSHYCGQPCPGATSPTVLSFPRP